MSAETTERRRCVPRVEVRRERSLLPVRYITHTTTAKTTHASARISEPVFHFKVKNSPHARHYKIKQGEYFKNFFLVQHTTFKTLAELIEFYSKSQNGLCVRLNQPCVKVGISIHLTARVVFQRISIFLSLFQLDQPAPPTLSFQLNREIDQKSLTKIKKLGSGEFSDVWQGKWNGTTDVAIKEFKGNTVQTYIRNICTYFPCTVYEIRHNGF